MRISWVLAALWAVAVHADDEPEVPTIPSGVCQTIQESPFPDDDDFFNFHQVKIGEKSSQAMQFISSAPIKLTTGFRPGTARSTSSAYHLFFDRAYASSIALR